MTLDSIISSHSSADIEQLRTQFGAQERALAGLGAHLSAGRLGSGVGDHDTDAAGDLSAQLAAILQKVCWQTLSAARAQRTEQRFGDIKVDNHSIAMQGIVGMAQPGVDQSFGSLTAGTSSRAFQGQMEPDSFGKLFGS